MRVNTKPDHSWKIPEYIWAEWKMYDFTASPSPRGSQSAEELPACALEELSRYNSAIAPSPLRR